MGCATAVTNSKLALQLAWAKATGDTQAVHKLQEELTFSSCDALLGHASSATCFISRRTGEHPYRSGGDYVLTLPSQTTPLSPSSVIGNRVRFRGGLARANRQGKKLGYRLSPWGHLLLSEPKRGPEPLVDICGRVLGDTPVFSLSGNHDMYSAGRLLLAGGQTKTAASYFACTMITGNSRPWTPATNDYNPSQFPATSSLTKTEADWHRAASEGCRDGEPSSFPSSALYRLRFDRQCSGEWALLSTFKDLLDAVSIWFWGHGARPGDL